MPLIIELKTPEAALARATVDELRAADAVGRVALGSFYSRGLHAARAYEPRIATGAAREETRWALYKSWVHWPLRRPAFREFQVPERSGRTTIVTPRFVRHAHRAGLPVKVWTVNAHEDIARLLAGASTPSFPTGRTWRLRLRHATVRSKLLPARRLPRDGRSRKLANLLHSSPTVQFFPPGGGPARLESRHALFEFCSA